MIRLTTKDAAILARVVQYQNLSIQKRREMLTDASPEARKIGLVLLGLEEPDSPDVRDIADAIKEWFQANRRHGARRLQRHAYA